MVKRVCRSSTALMLMFALLFTTFASLFIFTNEDTQGATKKSDLTYTVTTNNKLLTVGGISGYKYQAKSDATTKGNPTADMFCVQPSKAGWENNSKIYDDVNFKVFDIAEKNKKELMYKAVYYGYNGPVWDIQDSKGNYIWHRKIDNIVDKYKSQGWDMTVPNASANERYYIITHFVVSYIYNSSDYKFASMTAGWRNAIKDIVAEYAKQPSVSEKMTIYIANHKNFTSNGKQTMIMAIYARRMHIKKTSSDMQFVKGQGVGKDKIGAVKTSDSVLSPYADYSGARFAVFRDRSRAEKAAKQTQQDARESGYVAILTTDKNGDSTTDHIVGTSDNNVTYYAVESKGPDSGNYAISNTVYTFTKSKDYSKVDGLPLWTITAKDAPLGINLKITKKSANTDITQNNANYSLEGAEFAVFTSKSTADAAVKGKNKTQRTKGALALYIKTDAKGVGVCKDAKGNTVKLPFLPSSQGYYAVEYKAPKGYTLYNSVITFKRGSRSGNIYQYSATVNEQPKSDPIGVIAQKKDAVQGTYDTKDLAGAVFEVKYYDVDPTTVTTLVSLQSSGKKAVRTWYFKTDDKGELWYNAVHLADSSKYKSDALYTVSTGNYLPIGAITVKEVEAPTSGLYEINPTTNFSTVTGTESDVKVDMNITIPENPSTTMISVLKESDDGLVSNIYFRVTSSDGKVNEIIKTDESGSTYLDKLDVYMPDGKTKIEYTTSELGLMISGSDADRQKAKYKIPGRYKKPADQTTTLTPNKPSQIIFVNEIETGSLNIIKTADDNSDGHNTVENIAFKITNGSDSTKVYNATTDSKGNASLSNLPIYDDDGNVIKYKVTELGVASTVQRGYIYGDVDFNGIINADDALYVLKYSRGLITLDDTQLKVADVNGDGKITAEDNTCIQSYIVGIKDTSEIGKTGTICSELGEGQFTEYTMPKRYEKQADQTISLTANKTLTVTFNNKTLKGQVTVVKDSYDGVVSKLWFNLTSSEGTDAYLATDSKGYATFYDLPVYNDNDEKIVYIVTELGFKQADGTYIFPAYYVEQEPKTVTLGEATDSNGNLIYSGVTEFYNRMYTANLIILKNFTPITEIGVYAKFRIKSVTDGYSFDNTYTTTMAHFVDGVDGSYTQNGCSVIGLQPFLADGTPIVYEISEIEIVDGNGNKLPETYMTLLDSARVSWSKDDFNDETNTVTKDEDVIALVDTYVIDNYYFTGHLSIYKTADDNDVGDIWFKVECSDSIVKTQYVKTDKLGHAELDKIVTGTVKGGQLTYTVTELGKMTSGSEDAPEKATFAIPSKYVKPQPKTFTFDAGEIEPERALAFSNKLYGSFRVHKVDDNGKAVAGAVFQLLDTKGNVVGTCTTDSTGYSNTITGIPQGDYTVKEISTPKGFYLLRAQTSIHISATAVLDEYPWIGNELVDDSEYIYGDVNMDGTVDGDDKVLLDSLVGGLTAYSSEFQKRMADVNNNGYIDVTDCTALEKYLVMKKVTDLNYVYDVVETEQPPFPPAGGMNLFGVIIASSLFLLSLGSLMIVRRKAGK